MGDKKKNRTHGVIICTGKHVQVPVALDSEWLLLRLNKWLRDISFILMFSSADIQGGIPCLESDYQPSNDR